MARLSNGDIECYSSGLFQQLYDWAVQLIKEGKAVDNQSGRSYAEQKRAPSAP